MILMFCGCAPQFHEEFVQVVIDHNIIVAKIHESISDSISDRLAMDDLGEHEIKSLLNLQEWLYYADKSGVLIYEYVSEKIDQDMLSELLRNRWINQ